ncbi:hypothetical protein RJG79_06890 [Mycoplasmatota bacterium WC44]
MDMLERYLYQVGKYLPKNERKEILKELKYSILDEYDHLNNEGEDGLDKILIKFGPPINVVSKYSNKGNLISKKMELLYLFLLKIVSFSVALSLIIVTLSKFLTGAYDFNLTNVISELAKSVPEIIMTIISAIGSLTVIILIIDKFTTFDGDIFENSDFDPQKLDPVPKKIKDVSRVEEFFIIIFLSIFLFLINNNIRIIYINGVSVSLFNKSFQGVLLGINIIFMSQVCLSVFHFIKGYKNSISLSIDAIVELANGVVFIYLATRNIFNIDLIEFYGVPTFTLTIVRMGMFIGGIASLFKSVKTIYRIYFKD